MADSTDQLHAVAIRYPRKKGESFDFQHWANMHMPLGVATLHQESGIAPRRVMVQHETFGMDGQSASADSYATVWLVFDTRSGLEAFMRLHNDDLASAALSKDFANYTPSPPHIVLGKLSVFDAMDEVLERGDSLLRAR